MAESKTTRSSRELWAEFRFGIIGALLSSPPERGQLRRALRELAARDWRHPITGEPTRCGIKTIERWYYRCREERGSIVQVLRRKARLDIGCPRVLDGPIKDFLRDQHRAHPSWSYRLHADNVVAEIEQRGLPVAVPSRAAVRRWMQANGLFNTARCRGRNREGALAARDRVAAMEVRSFENEYVGGLWHLDFHHCSRQVLVREGTFRTPICVAVLDDHSRIACHVQWYPRERGEPRTRFLTSHPEAGAAARVAHGQRERDALGGVHRGAAAARHPA